MSEYIEREALSNALRDRFNKSVDEPLTDKWLVPSDALLYALGLVASAPTVPAEIVVHCRDCNIHDKCTFEDTFKLAKIPEESRYCCAGKHRESEKKQ